MGAFIGMAGADPLMDRGKTGDKGWKRTKPLNRENVEHLDSQDEMQIFIHTENKSNFLTMTC